MAGETGFEHRMGIDSIRGPEAHVQVLAAWQSHGTISALRGYTPAFGTFTIIVRPPVNAHICMSFQPLGCDLPMVCFLFDPKVCHLRQSVPGTMG